MEPRLPILADSSLGVQLAHGEPVPLTNSRPDDAAVDSRVRSVPLPVRKQVFSRLIDGREAIVQQVRAPVRAGACFEGFFPSIRQKWTAGISIPLPVVGAKVSCGGTAGPAWWKFRRYQLF